MRAILSKSGQMALVLATLAGCGTSGDKGSNASGLGKIQANIVFGVGNTLDSVTLTLSCTPTTPAVTTGTWNVSKSATISGVIGGVPSGDICTLSIRGTDSKGAAAGMTNNCTGMSANFAMGTTTSIGAISVACQDPGDVTPAGSVTTIGTPLTVIVLPGCGCGPHQCGGIGSYFASPGEVYVGNSISLTSTATTPTNGAVLTTTWTSDDGFTASAPNATYPCNTAGEHTITLSVLDTITGYTSSCLPNQATFAVTCTPLPGGIGGSTSTGGTSTTIGGSISTGGQGGSGGTRIAPVLDLSCASDSDCCVVNDHCESALLLVSLAQKSELEAYLASDTNPVCPACVPPQVDVSCQVGICVGVQEAGFGGPLSTPHCGTISTGGASSVSAASMAPASAAADPATGGASAQTVFGCYYP